MKILLVCLVILRVAGCSKEEPIGQNEFVTLSYAQTQCSDAWQTGTTDSITLVNVANYIQSKNLYIGGLSIKQESTGPFCSACTCPTGKIIYVSTLNSNLQKTQFAAIGFK